MTATMPGTGLPSWRTADSFAEGASLGLAFEIVLGGEWGVQLQQSDEPYIILPEWVTDAGMSPAQAQRVVDALQEFLELVAMDMQSTSD